MSKIAVGIDIGATYTKYGLTDPQGKVILSDKIETSQDPDIDIYLQNIHKAITDALDSQIDALELIGIGIGAPNANYYKGTIENAPNLAWKGNVPFVELLKNYFDVPILLTNDANAAAIGEMTYGGAKGMDDFVVITMGTGLGSGIVSNGEVVYGYSGFAGEIGHTTVNYNGRYCGCGRRGCLETYVSATGIKRTVYKLIADFLDDSELRGVSFDDLSTKMITAAAQHGDKIAIEAFKYTGRILGIKLCETIVHTNPEAIFLSGGLSNAGELIFEPVRTHLEAQVMPRFKGRTKILPSGLESQYAAILGAASLIWNRNINENSVDV